MNLHSLVCLFTHYLHWYCLQCSYSLHSKITSRMEYVVISLLSLTVGLTKAISDIVNHIDIWSNSVYSVYKEKSFYGPKDKTWIRKDHPNKIINYLLHNQLVFITDIWHFSNFINNLSIIFIMISLLFNNNYLMIIIYWLLRMISFHLFYHYILKNNLKQ